MAQRLRRTTCRISRVTEKQVLISTLSAGGQLGGVLAMTKFVVDVLLERDYRPVIGHYQPYTLTPELSVPIQRLISARPGQRMNCDLRGVERWAMGAWLPELQFTHYLARGYWPELIKRCQYHVAVSGSVHVGLPFVQMKKPFLCWAATPWEDDWTSRVQAQSAARRAFEYALSAPVQRRLERRILLKGHVLSLSAYTARRLDEIAGRPVSLGILPVPVDSDQFVPAPVQTVPLRIGFAGRYNDPRKNIQMMLEAAAHAAAQGVEFSIDLIGDVPHGQVQQRVAALGLEKRVRFISGLDRQALAEHMQKLDVFVLPSHQEGLCIAALEAMACGVPVVSTRCGGPEEFVIDGVTGQLVDFRASDMAEALLRITSQREVRMALSHGARRMVLERYSREAASRVFWKHFESLYPSERPLETV